MTISTHAQIVINKKDSSMQCGWAGSLLIDEELKIIYCSIPKNVCTKMKNMLRKFKGYKHVYEQGLAHDPHHNGLSYLCKYDAETVTQKLNDPSYLRFTVLRDPVERFISAYNNKIKPMVNGRFSKLRIRPNTTLEYFLTLIEPQISRNPEKVDVHVRPQYTFCDLHKTLPLFHTVRAEHVADDLKVLLTGWEGNVWERFNLTKFFSVETNHTTHTRDHMKEVAPRLKERIRKLYDADYKLFEGEIKF